MSKKKICLVIGSLQVGGMERVMSELANFFCEQPDLEVHLVLYGIKRDVFYSLNSKIIIHSPSFKFNNYWRTISTLRTLFFLRKKLKQLQSHATLSFGEYWNNFVLIASLGLGLKIFISDRCQPDKSLGKFHDFLRRRLYPYATGVIAQTEKAKECYTKFFNHSNITVIGNPIRPVTLQRSSILRENIILTVGRLIQTKHHDKLILLFSKINPIGWKLVIVGDDAIRQQNRKQLEQLIFELKLKDSVFLLGKQSDIFSFYARSKIFAFMSSSEGFPNVLGEALSAGLPVISFNCIAGPSDLINDGENGILIPLFDYEAYEKGLVAMLENENYRNQLASNATNSVEKYSISKIGNQYLNFILK